MVVLGNADRGDDAIGPMLGQRLVSRMAADRVLGRGLDVLAASPLQIEHCLDLSGREWVIFVDALDGGPEPVVYARLMPELGAQPFSHELAPGALLAHYERVTGQSPPAAWLLGVRGERFALGEMPGVQALANLELGWARLLRALAEPQAV